MNYAARVLKLEVCGGFLPAHQNSLVSGPIRLTDVFILGHRQELIQHVSVSVLLELQRPPQTTTEVINFIYSYKFGNIISSVD